MIRAIMFLVAATVVFIRPAGAAASMKVDGVDCGLILGWDGGDAFASVITSHSTTGGLPTKQPGNITWAPLIVRCAFPPPAPLIGWIGDVCANRVVRKTIVVTEYNALREVTGAVEMLGARLATVQLPAFDASSSTVGSTTLMFEVEQSRSITAASSGSLTTRTEALGSFRVAISGLDGRGVSRIEPITITQRASTSPLGEARVYSATAGSVEFSNLIITLTDASSASWKTWFTSFVLNGNSDDGQEKSGSLEFLNPNYGTATLALNFSQLGIIRLARVPSSGDGPVKNRAELYFERLEFGRATSSGSSTNTASSTATSEPAPTVEAVPETSTPATTAGIRPPIAATAEGVSTRPTSITTSAATTTLNSADQGTRDPAQFPRVTGLTRLSYSGAYQPTYTSEQAVYTTVEEINQVVARVTAAAEAGGFALRSLAEADTPNGKTVSAGWEKPRVTVSVAFLQPQSGATSMTVSVYVQTSEN